MISSFAEDNAGYIQRLEMLSAIPFSAESVLAGQAP